jgi:hypothetical protein
MKPLNQTERNNLYVKFFLLFAITVIITVFAIFFDFTTPAKLKESQRQKLKSYNEFYNSKKKMMQLIDTLNHQINEMGNSSMGWDYEKDRITPQINFSAYISDTSLRIFTDKLDNTFRNFLAAKAKAEKCKEEIVKTKTESQTKEEMNKTLLEIEKAKADAQKQADGN